MTVRFLVEACADRLWLVGGGRVRPFDGDMEDYRKFVLSGGLDENGGRETRRDERPVRTDDRKSAAQKRSQQAPLRKQLAQVEARIEKLTGVIAKIDAAIGDGEAFQRDPQKAAEISRMRGEAAEALERAEEEWLEISQALEA